MAPRCQTTTRQDCRLDMTKKKYKTIIDMQATSDSLHVHQGKIMKKNNTETNSDATSGRMKRLVSLDLNDFRRSTPPNSEVLHKGKKTKTMTAGWIYAGRAIVLIESAKCAVPIADISLAND